MKTSIKHFIKTGILLFIIFQSTQAFSQDIVKYDYAEIFVTQKILNTRKHKYELKKITLVGITDEKGIDEIELSALKTNAEFFKYMNERNWEYFSRTFDPADFQSLYIETQYIFRKKIKSGKE